MSKIIKTSFTAVDLENNLYRLATDVVSKKLDTKRVNSAVGAYRTILQLQNLKIKAAAVGHRDPKTSKQRSLEVK